eukprot:28787-Pelagococcus_subviridis.AAC.4
MYGRDSCLHTMYRHAPATCCVRRPRVKFLCTASLYNRCAAPVMSSRGRIPSRSATCWISCLPLFIVFSCESTCRPKRRPPRVPRDTPWPIPVSFTKLPSTCEGWLGGRTRGEERRAGWGGRGRGGANAGGGSFCRFIRSRRDARNRVALAPASRPWPSS